MVALSPPGWIPASSGGLVVAVELAMRLALPALGLLGCVFLSACSTTVIEPTPSPEEEPAPRPAPTTTQAPPAKERTPFAQPDPEPAVEVDEGTYAEVVYVLMRDQDFNLWFCTGTLVAENKVVTASHCLDPEMFRSYEVVAPLAPGEPRIRASQPKIFGGDPEVVENPDIGFLTLDKPIKLPRYGQLTNVVDRVEAGEELTGMAVVRTAEKPEAPLAMSQHLPLSSTVHLGYTYGFGTPYFSNGGDSGAGLFLVEDGQPTHKLIAVARQPEPDRDLDHFTRIDSAFLDWYAANND